MRTHLAFLLPFAALAVGSGCAFEPFDLGDHTDGDQGHSRWNVSDGMCPGLGSCGLDVPVAAGASVHLVVDLPDRHVAELTPVVTAGDATIGRLTRQPEDEYIAFDVLIATAGTVELAILDPSGETVDGSRLEARDAVGLDCGRMPENVTVGYEMAALLPDDHELTLSAASEESAPQLACLVTDAEGTPLLSADLVHWAVEDGPGLLRIQSELLDFLADDSADGARIWVSPMSTDAIGTAAITASMGDVTERFEVTIE